MKTIDIDTFDIAILLDKVIGFLEFHNVESINFNYFSLEVDEELTEFISISKIKERMIYMSQMNCLLVLKFLL